MSSRRPILTEITHVKHFAELLHSNPGKIILKFGATWCSPCKCIETQVYHWIDKMPSTVQSIILDIDVSYEVYAYLHQKKMIPGIPALLCYTQGNLSYVPDDSVIGADTKQINLFFQRCMT